MAPRQPDGQARHARVPLDDYGLDADEVAEPFAFYIERFAVPTEGATTR